MQDLSNGYEAEAESFISSRSPIIGVSVVRRWAQSYPAGTRILEIGCGSGIPLTKVLFEENLDVSAVDASPKMVTAFRQNFPSTPVLCRAAEHLNDFDGQFGAALAWGVIFLLAPKIQQIVIENISHSLKSGGRFLFIAPRDAATWTDVRTGCEWISLGISKYRRLMSACGLKLVAEYDDEGSNHYFEAEKQ